MTSSIYDARQNAADQQYQASLPRCFHCREPIDDEVFYVIDRCNYCQECAFKWLERRKHKNKEYRHE